MRALAWARGLTETGFRKLAIKPQTGTEAILFTGGNVLYQGARFLAYLLAAKLLGPTLYGLWNGLLLLLTNGIYYGHLGVLNAMSREIPLRHGRGDHNGVQPIVDSSFSTALLSSSLLAVVCLAASFAAEDPANALGLRLLAPLLVLEQLQFFYELVLRSHGLFRAVAIQQVLRAGLLLGVVLGLTWLAGFSGFLWGHVVVFLAVVAFLTWSSPVRPRLRFDRCQMMALARIGFPIMLTGFAYGMLTSLDRLMVLSFLGKTQLGYYSLAFMAYGTMMLIPRSVFLMVYPRMAREYGRTGDPRALKSLVYRPIGLLLVIMVPTLAAIYFFGPWFIGRFLPQYVPGIPAFRLTLLGVFFLSFVGGFGNLLTIVDRQKLYLAVQVFALGLAFVLNLIAIKAGWGILGVAGATLVAQVIYGLTLWTCARRVLATAPGPVFAGKDPA